MLEHNEPPGGQFMHYEKTFFLLPIESLQINATCISRYCEIKTSSDAKGFAAIGPFIEGERITIEISGSKYDKINQKITVKEELDSLELKMNPTVRKIKHSFWYK